MPKYRITLEQDAKQYLTVIVEADNEEEACELAREDPLEFDIKDETVEGASLSWDVNYCQEIEE